MLLTNARIISPGLDREGASVFIENGKITEIANHTSGDLDLGGKMLLPGFIDIHSHGADGADVCDASSKGLEHIAQTKLKEGVTTWLPTTLTQPQERLIEIVRTVENWADSAPLNIPGIHLEGPFIN
ncbi:amidohydrolase family protein, partial [bacterium]|nr:amidohydrolase family protein [bacterium]